MKAYPTLNEVKEADRVQLARWTRFLPSPGSRATGDDNFNEVILDESVIMQEICTRFKELGGMTPEISKAIGWEQ